MFAVILDEEGYVKEYSSKYRTPGSILVKEMPNKSDPEELRCYQYINGKFVLNVEKWARIKAERVKAALIEEARKAIAALKEQLAASDYQIIKCFEYSLLKKEMPYDMQALHDARQAFRDQINKWEENL